MKDILQDIIAHTSGLGFIDLIRVDGTDKETLLTAISQDKTVIVKAKLNNPVPEMIGTFGMPNLTKLKTILSFDEYDQDAKITVTSKQNSNDPTQTDLTAIHFETKNNDFVNDYRLMLKNVIEGQVKTVTFNSPTWDVDFTPTTLSISKLKKQSQVHSEEKSFRTVTENSDLKVYFGDPRTHSGNFVFHSGVTGKLGGKWQWPVIEIISILSLPGDKTMRIADQGAIEISVNSGLANYLYLIPGLTK